jgi:hypothetical protein
MRRRCRLRLRMGTRRPPTLASIPRTPAAGIPD